MNAPKSIIPLKSIDFEGTARAVETFSKTHNIPSLSFPQQPPRAAIGEEPQLLRPIVDTSRVMKRMPMVVPEYVMESLKKKAHETKGASVRFVVLSALKAYGIEVRDEELVKDKRRSV